MNYWKPRRLGAYTRRVRRGEQLRVFNGVGMLAPSPQTCWYILCWKSCWLTPWCLAVIAWQIRMMNVASGQNHFSAWLFGYPRISLLFVYYNMIHTYHYLCCRCLSLYYTIVCLSIRLILFSPISSNKNLQVRRFKFHLPDYYVALVRALLTLEGIALAADCHLMKKLKSALHDFTQMSVWGSTNVFIISYNVQKALHDMCFLYSMPISFFESIWNHRANSCGPQKLVMIWARAVFYSVFVVGRLYWRYILLAVLVSKMQGYPLRRHWQPTSVTHLWKPTSLDSTQQKTCRWTYVG